MKKHLNKYILLILSLFVFNACTKEGNGDITPESVSGKWIIQTLYSNVEFKNDAPETQSEDISSQGLYFDFAADGTYTTNGAIELGDINENGGALTSGQYEFVGGVLNLTYQDPDLGIPVTLYLDAEISGNTMTLSLDKSDLVEAFANATGVDAFTQAFVQIFLDEILTFEYSMTLQR